jgi:hypothetical protein
MADGGEHPSAQRVHPAHLGQVTDDRRMETEPTDGYAVILTVIPQAITEPNQTALARIAAQPDLARPNWTVESRRWAVIS